MAVISSTWNYYSPTYITTGEHISTAVTGIPNYLQASIKYSSGTDTYLTHTQTSGNTSERTYMTAWFLGNPGEQLYNVKNSDIYKYQSAVINFELKYACPRLTTLILYCGSYEIARKEVTNAEDYRNRNGGSWTVTITEAMTQVTPSSIAGSGITLKYTNQSIIGTPFNIYGADFNILQRQHIVYYLTPRAYINIRTTRYGAALIQQIPLYTVDELKQCLTDNTSFNTTSRTNVIYARVNSATYASIPATPSSLTEWTGSRLLSELNTNLYGVNAKHYYQAY